LVDIVGMETPASIYSAGSDALTLNQPIIDERIQQIRDFEALSRSSR
jgi:hypothetical protein